jgi:AcrR family transcriptional regulator/DNA-binding MarR family transcriptional regulator
MSSPADDVPGLRSGVQEKLVRDVQRMWIVSAMARIVFEQGLESVSVQQIVARAGVTRRTFYELFESREDCFRAVFEESVAMAAERACAAYRIEGRWVERIRAGLLALLAFFDSEPELARLCVLHATPASPTLTRRGEVLEHLALVIDEGRRGAPAEMHPPPLTAQSVVGGVLAVVQARLLEPNPRRLAELVGPLMGVIALPYLGQEAAWRELSRPVRETTDARTAPEGIRDPLRDLDMRLTYRTLRVLAAIAVAPGISNRDVAQAAGVRDEGQISRLLARLERLGLVRNTDVGRSKGRANAWSVTRRGAEVDSAIALARGRVHR